MKPPLSRVPDFAEPTGALILRLFSALRRETDANVILSALLSVTVGSLVATEVELEAYIERLRIVDAETREGLLRIVKGPTS